MSNATKAAKISLNIICVALVLMVWFTVNIMLLLHGIKSSGLASTIILVFTIIEIMYSIVYTFIKLDGDEYND